MALRDEILCPFLGWADCEIILKAVQDFRPCPPDSERRGPVQRPHPQQGSSSVWVALPRHPYVQLQNTVSSGHLQLNLLTGS